AAGVVAPLPGVVLGAARDDLAARAGHERDALAVELADHRQHVLDVLDRALALPLIPGSEVPVAQHQGHRAPAPNAMLLAQGARFPGLVLLGFARNLDRLIAELLDALERHLERLRPHPVVRRKMHDQSFPPSLRLRRFEAAALSSPKAHQQQSGSTNWA